MNNRLWNKNFSLITIGSFISMMGNAVSNFALGLVIYNHTSSTLLYALFIILNTLPKIIVPMLAGPFVDRYSRKNIVVAIDTIYGFLFLGFAYIIYLGYFQYSLYIMFSMILGILDSFYNVAYQSLYPGYISEGNFSKAYSISSLIYPIANTVMVPIAGFVYEGVGVFPLFLFNAVTFFLTQGMERFLDADQNYRAVEEDVVKQHKHKVFWNDFKEGIVYLKNEPGLMAITGYFFISLMAVASSQTLLLPYFTGINMVTTYSIIMAGNTLGRIVGGLVHYKFKYPAHLKFSIAVSVYIITAILEGGFLYLAFPLMPVCEFMMGMLAVTSYNIRISGTQSYLEPDKRGRFNGLFMMVTMLGSMIGQFTSGALGEIFPIRYVISGFMVINIIGAITIMSKNKDAVKKIYNQNL